MGITFATFQSLGSWPVHKDCLKMWNNIWEDVGIVFFSIFELILSRPLEVETLRLLISLVMPSMLMFVERLKRRYPSGGEYQKRGCLKAHKIEPCRWQLLDKISNILMQRQEIVSQRSFLLKDTTLRIIVNLFSLQNLVPNISYEHINFAACSAAMGGHIDTVPVLTFGWPVLPVIQCEQNI